MNTLLCISLVFGLALSAVAADAPAKKEKLRHVVSFKFKETATPAQIKEVESAFRALKSKIPVVVAIEWGTNISPEKRDKGFTHCWIVTFNNEKDRDTYLIHPQHKKFVELAIPIVSDVFVLDFMPKD